MEAVRLTGRPWHHSIACTLLLLACFGSHANVGLQADMGCIEAAPRMPDVEKSPALVTRISSARYSGPLPLASLWRNDLSQIDTPGAPSLMYLRDEARICARWDGAWLSMVGRQSATLTSSAGALRVVKALSNAQKGGVGYDAEVSLRLRGFAGLGLGIESEGIARFASALTWRIGIQGLQLTRLLWRDIEGQVRRDALSGQYTFELSSWQANDRMTAPFLASAAPAGWAILFEGALSWQPQADWLLGAHIKDVGQLWWERMPTQDMVLSSSTSAVDGHGYLQYKPLIQGQHRSVRFQQGTDFNGGISVTWLPAKHWRVIGRLEHVQGFKPLLPYGALAWHGEFWSLEAGRLWHEGASSFRLRSKNWSLICGVDRLDKRRRTQVLGLEWRGEW